MQSEPQKNRLLPKQQRPQISKEAQICRIRWQSPTCPDHLRTSWSNASLWQSKASKREERFDQNPKSKYIRCKRKMNYWSSSSRSLRMGGERDHLGVSQPIKRIKGFAEKRASFFVWTPPQSWAERHLSFCKGQHVGQLGHDGIRRKKKRWRWTQEQWVARTLVLTPDQSLSSPEVLVSSGTFRTAWNQRTQ